MIKKINSIIICHSRMLLSGIQTRMTGPPTPDKNIRGQAATFGGDRRSTHGQTALVLILLAAAALIFLAVTLNWGRIAQTKTLLTIASDQSATLLASDAASYGQMQKQTYLNDKNKKTESTGLLDALIMVIIDIVVAVVAIATGQVELFSFAGLLLTASIVFSVVNLVLQAAVVQPMITSLWNKLQSNQPVPQQFYEGAIQTALEGSVTDRVKITDYLDWNAKGIAGNNAHGFPNDTVSRFAVFYTDRLKMINGASPAPIPQVQTFFTQLGYLMNGTGAVGGFQLNDACPVDSISTDSTYSPYCDPCCQPNPPSTASCGSSNCSTNNPYGSSYPNIYDSSFQNYAKQLSFLDQFGRDQQMGPFTTSISPNVIFPASGTAAAVEFPNGVYPFFWLMKDYSPQVDNIDPTYSLQASQYHWCSAATAAVNGVDIPAFTAPTGFTDLAQLTLPYTCQAQDCCVNYLPDTLGCCTSGVPMRTCPAPVNGVCPAGTTLTPTFDSSFKGTANGAIDIVGSVGTNPSLDTGFGASSTSSWVEGDNQMCETATWPYNGANSNVPDGTCELSGGSSATANSSMTIDALDDTLHTLSDFVNFATTFLGENVSTLSSTFATWYPQAADWVAPCDDGSNCGDGGTGLCLDGNSCPLGRLLPLPDTLKTWSSTMKNWLNITYVNSNAWCVPLENDSSMINASNGKPTDESAYIATNGAANDVKDPDITSQWGDLGYVNACLNYNATKAPANFQQCWNVLSGAYAVPPGCPAVPSTCYDRSLIGPPPDPSFSTYTYTVCDAHGNNCVTYCAFNQSDIQWAQNSFTMATDEAPKFSLRYQFLNDVYTRAQTLQMISSPSNPTSGYNALNNFIDPNNPNSPSAQLTWAFNHQKTAVLPNSVIYGWVDATPSGSGGCWDATHTRKSGCAHIVKVTAYSPGRYGASSLPAPSPSSHGTGLPWIQTKITGRFLGIPTSRSFTLMNRDGYTWVGIRRWDEDHNPVLFPNGHTLWQSLFHNPIGGKTETGYKALPTDCIKLPLGSTDIGFGLLDNTITGLKAANITSTDAARLGDVFMLNGSTSDGKALDSNETGACQSAADALLANAPESHACAAYIASLNASGPSQNSSQDYSVRFVSDSLCAPQKD